MRIVVPVYNASPAVEETSADASTKARAKKAEEVASAGGYGKTDAKAKKLEGEKAKAKTKE